MYENSDIFILHKVIHDILDCITSYNECMRIIQRKKNELHPDVLNTLTTWKNEVNNWQSEILLITKYIEEHSETSTNWMMILEKIRLVIQKSSDFKIAMQSLADNKSLQLATEIAIRQSTKLELINQALQAQDYEKLKTSEHWQ